MRRLGLLRVLIRRVLGGGIGPSLWHVVRHPDRVILHVRRLLRGDTGGLSNKYGVSDAYGLSDRTADVRWVAAAASAAESHAASMFAELDDDSPLIAEIRATYARGRPEWASTFDLGRFRSLYALTRLVQPAVVLETGVHDGLSTALVLEALARNGRGRLFSIDRPSSDLPPGQSGPGWLIPHRLRDRWELRTGDARRILAPTAADVGPVDLFFHDSDHSVEHRTFEFTTVKPYMAGRGIIVSDDDEPSDGVLGDLATQWDAVYHPPAGGVRGLGAVRPRDLASVQPSPADVVLESRN